METTWPQSVRDYIARQPPKSQAILRRVRSTIRKSLPGAEEVISYQIPAYKRDGGYVVYFAGWKEHYSLYPVTGRIAAALGDELAPYKLSKGTVRFPLSEKVPVKLIERITKLLAKEARARAEGKRAGARKRRGD